MPRFRTAVAAVVWAFAPAGLYLVSAMQPQTVGYSGRVALVAIGIGIFLAPTAVAQASLTTDTGRPCHSITECLEMPSRFHRRMCANKRGGSGTVGCFLLVSSLLSGFRLKIPVSRST